MATPDVPVFKQKEKIEQVGVPDYQSTYQRLAESQHIIGDIGAKVAQSASNAMAAQLGYEAGKTPHGNLTPSLTEFDQNFTNSYNQQAHATLSLQGDKLLADAYITLGKAPKLTPGLIASTNQQVQLGLNKISQNAPTAVRGQLQSTFDSKLLQQTTSYNEKMIGQQRQEQRDIVTNAIDVNNKTILDLAKNGDINGATKLRDQNIKLAENGHATNLISLEAQTKAKETAQQVLINGSYINGLTEAYHNGKSAEYLKNYADGKLPGQDKLTNDQREQAGVAISNQLKYLNGLKATDENITAQQMHNKIAISPSLITDQEWQSYKDSVSPLQYEKTKFQYIQAVKAQEKKSDASDTLIQNWGSSEAQAIADPKVQKESYLKLVDQTLQKNPGMTRDDAEAQVAASAGSEVGVYKKLLEDKLTSGNPNEILSGVNQISTLDKLEAARAYDGISKKAKAIAIQFQHQRGTMSDTDLARKITDNLSNIDDTMQKTLDNSWNLWLTSKGAAGIGATKPLYKYALREVGLTENQLGGNYFAVLYGNDIYNQLKDNFTETRGDYQTALKMTQDYVNEHYKETWVNGSKQKSDSSIEKYLGFKTNDGTPYIQQDLLNQLDTHFAAANATTGKLPEQKYEHWETLPLKDNVAQVKRTVATNKGIKEYTYPVNLVGRAGNQWDVVLQTPTGPHNLFLVAPHVGLTNYQPNDESIKANYNSGKTPGFFARTASAIGNFFVSPAKAETVPNEDLTIATTPTEAAPAEKQELKYTPVEPHPTDSPRYDFLKEKEGKRGSRGDPVLEAYKDLKNGKWTIGWGHIKGVKEGDTITEQEAKDMLAEDLKPTLQMIKKSGINFNDNQMKALISLGHRTKVGLQDVLDAINPNSTNEDIKEAFMTIISVYQKKKVGKKIIKSHGYTHKGLAARALEEADLFNKPEEE